MGNLVKRILYIILPLDTYFWVLSKFYFISFNLGLLKNKKEYIYPYFLKNIISKGDACVDIGANLGYYATNMSKLVGKNGSVTCFEPVQEVLKVLRRNTKRLGNVTIYPFALGLENKKIKLGNNTAVKKGFLGSGSHFVLDSNITKETSADVEFDAEMKNVDEVFNDFDKIDFIKCDIEGYEAFLIPAMEKILMKHLPMLLIEARGQSRERLLSFFRSRQFEVYVLKGNKLILADVKQFEDLLVVPNVKTNMIEKFID